MKTSVGKDQRGIAQVVIVLLVLVVIGAAGFVGWRVTQNNKKPAAVKTSAGKAVNDACMKIYNDKSLCYAATASSDFDKLAYTAVDTAVDAQGQTSKITLEADGKGNTSFTTSSGGQDYSTVMIGNTVYTKTPGSDSWTKYTSGDTQAPTTDPANDLKTEFSNTGTPADKRIQYKKIGKEACGNQTCLKYQVIDPATPGTTTFVWFNTKNYRLQRLNTKDSNGSNDFVITYQAVKITTPSPVTDASSAASAQSQAEMQALQAQAQAAASQYGQ